MVAFSKNSSGCAAPPGSFPAADRPTGEDHASSLSLPVEEMGISCRAYHALKKAKIFTLGDVVRLSEKELLDIQNIGPKALREIKNALVRLGIVPSTIECDFPALPKDGFHDAIKSTAAMVMLFFCGFLGFLFSLTIPVYSLDRSIALTPPMGWNTFNQFGGAWNANTIKLIADSLVANGLRDCGYIYVVCDGHNDGSSPYWPGYPGFVNFAKPLADYVHSKGMKFGVYTSEFKNPQKIASDLAAAECDFIKVDAWTSEPSDTGWKALGDALEATGRKIVYSTHSSLPGVSHMWRVCSDIDATWDAVMYIYDQSYSGLANSGPGSWADPDMLEVSCRGDNGWEITDVESRAHFSMWCMMAAPLIAGYDFSRSRGGTYDATRAHHVMAVAIHSNTEMIAVDQDSLGKPGRRIKGQGALEVWIKELKDGTKAVALFNRTRAAANMSINQTELGWPTAERIYVRDLWLHQNLSPFTGTFTKNVASHAAEVFRMSTAPIEPPTEILRKMDRAIEWLAKNGYEVFPRRMIPGIVMANATGQTKIFDLKGRATGVFNLPRMAAGTFLFETKAAATGGRSALLISMDKR